MTIQHVHFMSEAEACEVDGHSHAGIISITDPDYPQATLKIGWGAVLRLSFDDAEYDHALIRTYDRVADFREQHKHDPQPEHAKAIQVFLDRLNNEGIEKLVVHCRDGRSLSAAVARYAVETYGCTLAGGSLGEINRTLFQLLQNPMTYELALKNMESAEAANNAPATGLIGTLKALGQKWFA